jgi:Xaa-Pro aminopeptidase
MCQIGVEWHDVHRTAAAELAAGLRHLEILKVPAEEALESGAIAIFFPHGIGHMVGLGVRDVGGSARPNERQRKCCGVTVRIDLPLDDGFLMTIEPGIYFVSAILDDPARQRRFRNEVAWDGLGRWRKVGGIRIEDNVVVTTAGPSVMTSQIPK